MIVPQRTPGTSEQRREASARPRVLLVDDEALVLDALRGVLRRQRRSIEVETASTGQVALDIFAQRPADVVVTDMAMPGMDGAELLAAIRDARPATVRIVLSGWYEREASLRALPVAHQFVSKPCPADQFREIVLRACSLRDVLADGVLRAQIAGMRELPMLSRTYVELSTAMADPDSGADDIARIVEKDPGVVARVLRLVNSGFFGLEREVCDPRRAVAYLGFDVVRSVVLIEDTLAGFGAGGVVRPDELDRFREHCLSAGILARKLHGRLPSSDLAFTAGVLHDVGKLVLAAIGADSSTEHAAAGAFLLGLWGLPARIVEAVAHHHDPWEVASELLDLPITIQVADWLTHSACSSLPSADIDLDRISHLLMAPGVDAWLATARAVTTSAQSGG